MKGSVASWRATRHRTTYSQPASSSYSMNGNNKVVVNVMTVPHLAAPTTHHHPRHPPPPPPPPTSLTLRRLIDLAISEIL
ncbi:hypothetical protein J6590_012853 [Homalodisca vitripennis]|nr:hypothetical protein J6590_012853 [Homalodisca vitripennis]